MTIRSIKILLERQDAEMLELQSARMNTPMNALAATLLHRALLTNAQSPPSPNIGFIQSNPPSPSNPSNPSNQSNVAPLRAGAAAEMANALRDWNAE